MQYAQYLLFLSIVAVLMAIYLLSEINGADQDDANEKKRRLRNLFSVQFGLLIIFLIGALSLVLMLSKGSAVLLAPVSSAGWSALKVKIGLSGLIAVLVFIALVGVYPLSYLAYRQVVSASQKKRLAEDFMLLGLHNRENAKREADEQYELAYSPKQYIWYILLIMLISALVMFGYALPVNSAVGAIDKPVLLLVFYAYLGAYVFSIQELIRRFNTEDLRPQVYSSILMRMLVAMAIVFVGAQILIAAGQTLNSGGSNGLTAAPEFWAAILAFLIGIFPKSGIEWFQKLARTTLSTPEEVNSLPIRNIQGISTWHEARLVEMGIDDVQNLATVDIRRVLLSTRFDIQEVINWIDQAILYAKVREKYPRFKDAAISTFHEFRLRLQQAQSPDSQRQGGTLHNDLQNLAVRLGLAVDEDLEYLADSTAYSNYLVHLGDDGAVLLPFTQAKQVLDRLKRLCIGRDLPDAVACARFDKTTRDGKDMSAAQDLLAKAVASVVGKKEERAVASLFTPGGTHAMKGEFQGINDFEVVAFLVVLPETATA